jgi:polyhydroxyalkanoate synthase subunit PhaC
LETLPPPHSTSLDELVHAELSKATMGLSPIALSLAYADWAMHLSASPAKQLALAQLAMKLSQDTAAQQLNIHTDISPFAKDARFENMAWANWPFKLLKDSYQAQEEWWEESTQVTGVSKHHAHVMRFFTRQWLDAISPSNWALTNPEVLATITATGGQSMVKGIQQYVEDLKKASMHRLNNEEEATPPLAFEVGKDVAITPGKVVYKNNLIELIQYSPTTEKVHPEPVLIVPSCIMKYYILDLSPHNSMVKYLVSEGFTVFMVSWRNPDSDDGDLGMRDYMQMGLLDAIDAVQSVAKVRHLHAMGYCLGGTFLSIAAAVLSRGKHASPLASVTLLAAQTDFSEPGELGVFIDDDQLLTLREEMAKTGYLSGKQMAGSFQFLNSRDLIWSRNTQRYLFGREEVGNDMVSWNKDTTRVPARMHNEYLDSLFLNNSLSEGHYRVDGKAVDLMDIQQPLMVVGTVRDHISPWKSVFKIHAKTDTETCFILAAGGHNAGIISEPGHTHRSYQIKSMPKGHTWIDPDDWLTTTPTEEGSWWPAWSRWLKHHSGALVKAKGISNEAELADAPGQYVLTRYND